MFRRQSEDIVNSEPIFDRPMFRSNEHMERDEHGYYPIVCPHCLEKFHIWEIEFRAAEGSVAKDENSSNTSSQAAMEGLNLFGSNKNTDAKQDNQTIQTKNEDQKETAFPREIDQKNRDFQIRVGKIGPTDKAEPMNKVLRIFDDDGKPTGEVHRVKLMDENCNETGDWIYLEGRQATDPLLQYKPLKVVQDKFGTNSYERICPHCHNTISNLFGMYPGYVIGVIGNTFCGKSVYITRICEILENSGILSKVGGYRFSGHQRAEYATAKAKNMDDGARHGAALLDPTRIEYIEPLVLDCWRGSGSDRTRMVVTIFDFPGEALQPGKEIDDFFKHYSNVKMNVDGWMFLFDSTNFKSVSTIIRQNHPNLANFLPDNQIDDAYNICGNEVETKEKRKAAVTMEPQAVLMSFVDKFLKGGTFSVPVSFVITKSDMLQKIWADIRTLRPDSMVPNPEFLNGYKYSKIDTIDLDQIKANSDQIQIMLGEDGLNDWTAVTAEDYTKDDQFAWFAVSAMGTHVKTGFEADVAQPIRVEEPIAWLLYMMGVLPGESSDNNLWR